MLRGLQIETKDDFKYVFIFYAKFTFIFDIFSCLSLIFKKYPKFQINFFTNLNKSFNMHYVSVKNYFFKSQNISWLKLESLKNSLRKYGSEIIAKKTLCPYGFELFHYLYYILFNDSLLPNLVLLLTCKFPYWLSI